MADVDIAPNFGLELKVSLHMRYLRGIVWLMRNFSTGFI